MKNRSYLLIIKSKIISYVVIDFFHTFLFFKVLLGYVVILGKSMWAGRG